MLGYYSPYFVLKTVYDISYRKYIKTKAKIIRQMKFAAPQSKGSSNIT